MHQIRVAEAQVRNILPRKIGVRQVEAIEIDLLSRVKPLDAQDPGDRPDPARLDVDPLAAGLRGKGGLRGGGNEKTGEDRETGKHPGLAPPENGSVRERLHDRFASPFMRSIFVRSNARPTP